MAQYRTDLKKLDSQQVTTRYEVNMLSDQLTPGGALLDAFGRLRVSNQHTIFDNTHRFSDHSHEWDTSLSGSGSITHSLNTSSILMNVGTASGDKVIRQTKRYFAYQPGKSLLIKNSFNMQPKENVRSRVGYFDSNNGIYLEHDGTSLYVVKRSYTTGSVVETRIPQSQWSEDKLDGSGYSKKTLDITKSQIFWCDIEWLGVGTVRAGFVIDGVNYVVHKFHHANIITSTYIGTATLPIRYEIENTSSTLTSTYLEHICNTISSEGGHTPRVSTRAASNALTGLNVSNVTYTPLVALRLKSSRIGGVAIPTLMNIYGLQNTPFSYKVYQDVSITGGTWVSEGDESNVEYNTTPTSFTGGSTLLQGIFIGGTNVQPTTVLFSEIDSSYQLKVRINGTTEALLIAALATTNNDDALASLTWEEIN